MKIALRKIIFASILYCCSIQVEAQFLGGEGNVPNNIRLTNILCLAVNTNPFLGGEADGHANGELSNVNCPVINTNPFTGGEADGHSNIGISNVNCPVINNNPFTGGEADGHSNEGLSNVSCPVVNVNPFNGGESDGHSNEELINNPLCLPLQVELLTFMATPMDKVVELKWSTSLEINNDFFTIERSKNGISFEAIENIKGAGNSSTVLSYYSLDNSPLYGISYYRLKQTDFDGQYKYSEVVSVQIENEGSVNSITYPSPFTNELTIELIKGTDTSAKYEIINALGTTVLTGFFSQRITLPTTIISSGVYLVKIENGTLLEIRKIIKE